MTAVPRLGPGSVIIIAGPDVRYVFRGLETSGATAKILLRTEDGLDWSADRPPSQPEPIEVRRRPDEEARRFYVEEGNLPESLAAARIAVEHVEHHGQPLRFVGSSYPGAVVVHRFACADRTCPFRLAWSTTS